MSYKGSDTTYCSEAEEMLVQADKLLPRRSQRLSQKITPYYCIKSTPNTTPPAIFSPTDLREDQAVNDSLTLNQKINDAEPPALHNDDYIMTQGANLSTDTRGLMKSNATILQEKKFASLANISPSLCDTPQLVICDGKSRQTHSTLSQSKKVTKTSHDQTLNCKTRYNPNLNDASQYKTLLADDQKILLVPTAKTVSVPQKLNKRKYRKRSKPYGKRKEKTVEDVPLDLSTKKSEESWIKTSIDYFRTKHSVHANDNHINIATPPNMNIVYQNTFDPISENKDKLGNKTETPGSDSVQIKTTLCTKDLREKLKDKTEIRMECVKKYPTNKDAGKNESPATINLNSKNEAKTGISEAVPQKKRKRNPSRKVKVAAKLKNQKTKTYDHTTNFNETTRHNVDFQYRENAYEELNGIQPTRTFPKMSILPDIYPPHFKYQLPPAAVLTQPLISSHPNIMTPDETQSFELKDSTSTSPSLPESLQGIFDTDDLRHLLNIEKVSYRLYEYHVQALAVVLNLRVDYLHDLLNKILKINPNVLRKINNALKTPFVQDHDLFEMENSRDTQTPDNEIVLNSHSPEISARLLMTQTKRRKLS